MKNWLKRSLALLLCLVLLATAVPAFSARAEEIELIPIEEEEPVEPVGEEEIVLIEEPTEPMGVKPTITSQPKDLTINEGETAKFTVKATNADSYQWYWRTDSSSSWQKSTVSTATKATLVYTNLSASKSGRQYRCKVSNSSGYIYTNAATLTVSAKPVITTQPKDLTISAGGTAKFTVKASGATSYQWYWRANSSSSWQKSTVSSATKATLTYTNLSASKSGRQYRCKVSNGSGYVYTNAATLTVTEKPVITTQPKNVTAVEDTTIEFAFKASGATSYQWYYRKSSTGSWAKSTLSGCKTEALSVKATEARDGYQYRCKVSNSKGYVYTKAVTLTVQRGAPMITKQPKSVTVDEGGSASFTVKAAGGALSYQWFWWKESANEWVKCGGASATTATLSYTYLSHTWDGYKFCCLISNEVADLWTDDVTLTVVNWIPPTITTEPMDVTIKEGETATFTLKARYADSYQWYWWRESDLTWVKCAGTGAKTATMSYSEVEGSWDGYVFYCEVTNSKGRVSSDLVTLHISGRTAPVITTQPTGAVVNEGDPASFSVKAKYADSYQWEWRTSSSDAWNTISSGTSAKLSYSKVYAGWNGYQFRCKVSNSRYYTYTNVVTLTVNPTTYRALLVGEVHFSTSDIATRNEGDVDMMADMLGSVKGPTGGSYTVTKKIDLSKDGLEDAISSTFYGADANDVSLIFIATHGSTAYSSGENAGRLTLLAAKYSREYMTIQELADCLNEVPGTIIVILGSCGSGSSILENGASGTEDAFDAQAFNEAAIGAFAALEPVSNTGELRDSKFYVLTAAAHQESSFGHSDNSCNFFTEYITKGCGTGKPADANGNGTITLAELYDYVYWKVYNEGPFNDDGNYVYQHVQVYPENSSYALFK